MVSVEGIKSRNKNFLAIALAIAIISLVMLAGPAAAFIVSNWVTSDDTIKSAQPTTITMKIQKNSNEVYNDVKLKLRLPNGGSIDIPATSCTPGISSIGGYGYGYQDIDNTIWGYGYGYGYSYGYGAAGTYLTCTFDTNSSTTPMEGVYAGKLVMNGYEAADGNSALFTVDNTAPVVHLVSPTDDYNTHDYNPEETADPFNSMYITVTDNNSSTVDCNLIWTENNVPGDVASFTGIPADGSEVNIGYFYGAANVTFTWRLSCYDGAGNVGTSEQWTYTVDNNAPIVNLAQTVDTDLFYGKNKDINIQVIVSNELNLGQSGVKTVYVKNADMNGNFLTNWTAATLNADGNYSVNTGSAWDANFVTFNLSILVTDSADNNSVADYNIAAPILLYAMANPPGTDSNGSTNFQDVDDFEHIDTLIIKDIDGRGQIAYYNQDINLSTQAQALKLMALQDALSMSLDATTGNTDIDLNSTAFNDINKEATISIYDLPFASIPQILMDDANCSATNCFGRSYNAGTGQLDFNVLHFTKYSSDGNAPNITNASTSTNNSVTLAITLNESATCRYSTSDVNYDSSGNTSSYGTSANWGTFTSGIQSNTTYTYYVQCRDLVGNDSNKAISISTQSASGGTTGGSISTGTNEPTITVISESTDTYTPSPTEIQAMLEAAKGDNGEPLFTAAEIAEMIADSVNYTFTRTIKVEEIKDSAGNITYRTTFTISVKNNNTTDMEKVLIVETIPKAIASTITASQITSVLDFEVLAADPVIQFVVPLIKAGQTYTVSYELDTNVKPDTNAANFASPVIGGETAVKPTSIIVPGDTNKPTGTTDTGKTGTNPIGIDPSLILVIVILVVLVAGYFLLQGKPKKKK